MILRPRNPPAALVAQNVSRVLEEHGLQVASDYMGLLLFELAAHFRPEQLRPLLATAERNATTATQETR